MPSFRHKQLLDLALALPLALAASAAAHAQTASSPAATIGVSNCNDSGPGSLRAAVAMAASGDTINLRSLECRRLVLTSGAIQIPQNDLTLLGPTRAFTIDGNQTSQVLHHTGTGMLRLRAMSIAYGRHSGRAVFGGCVGSEGDLRLEYVRVHDCELFENIFWTEGDGGGGGIAGNKVALYDSDVLRNTAIEDPSCTDCLAVTLGGGILATDHLTLVRSRVSSNRVGGAGGGFHVGKPFNDSAGGLHVRYSEISGNRAGEQGAFFARGQEMLVSHSLIADNVAVSYMIVGMVGPSILIANTTVSGNVTHENFSALNLSSEETSIVNSTIVNNVETLVNTGRGCSGALAFLGQLHLESTIIARNMCDGDRLDIRGFGGSEIVGSDNLVLVSELPLPPDTISANPRFSPLADNGGRTRTHALWAGSPAVDMGNNNAGLEFDQRGPGFNRVNGTRADIGAYER